MLLLAPSTTHTHTYESVMPSFEKSALGENAASWNEQWNVLLLGLSDVMETDLLGDC